MLRKRKTRGYNESNDHEDDGGRKYNLRDKIRSERFDDYTDYLQEFHGSEVSLRLIQRHGFEKPILVQEPEGLELRVPPKGFSVRDVRDCVGDDRIIDVMDVRTQKNIEMTMKDWCKYYESKRRDRLLNVISLEFSHTELDAQVEAPSVVRLLDWVDLVWPKFLKESQTESTNKIDKMKYPKVQKYCLMSVKGSYTDFHIDFGGTSVWYHILQGKKIFWMVPPTELNLQTFEEWTLSGMQQEVFFGDTVEECFRVELTTGNTFFIPSGWIHAVYTVEDSLVFGGNFLHSFGIENQLKVSKVEDATKVPVKFRYPFYTEIQWYVVQHYVHCLTGRDHLHQINKSASGTPEKPAKSITETTSSPSIKSSSQARDSKLKRNMKKDDDDETETESEKDESDTVGKAKTKKKSASTAQVGRNKQGKSSAAKKSGNFKQKSKKQISSSEDETENDDSETEVDTEIDTDEESMSKKKQSITCRMTKNSLLRLQYEVDQKPGHDQDYSKLSPAKQHDKNSAKSTTIDVKTKIGSAELLENSNSNKLSFDIDKLMTSHQDATRVNGWSSMSGANSNNQTSWTKLSDSDTNEPKKIHITKNELNGLKLLVKHLSKLSGAKKNLPTLIRNSRSLLDDCKKMMVEHENDDPELAVTGRPITFGILQADKADMNHLIEQFFKHPTETTVREQELASQNSANKCLVPKVDSTTLTHQHKNKFINANFPLDTHRNEERKNSGSTSDSSSSTKESQSSISPSKKIPNSSIANSSIIAAPTQFLSPIASMSNTESNPPKARPKSPPTRPISNNQYKPKKDPNNLVLPGSFADLIAATSTDKKVFDVTGSNMALAVIAPKEAQRNSTGKPVSGSSSPQKSINSESKSLIDPLDLLTKPAPIPPSLSHSPVATQKPCANAHMDMQQVTKPNSPEPPKMSPPKRFINPAFKPVNKEKLIFASAPYVSPVSQTTQMRPGSLYPWQSPAPQQTSQSSKIPGAAHATLHPSSPQKHHEDHTSHTKPSPSQKHFDSRDESEHPNNRSSSVDGNQLNVGPKHDDITPSTATPIQNHLNSSKTSIEKSVDKVDGKPNTSSNIRVHNVKIETAKIDTALAVPSIGSAKEATVVGYVNRASTSTNQHVGAHTQPMAQAEIPLDNQLGNNQNGETKAKKPTKPRGPPKKSKEARQVVVSNSPGPVVTTGQRFLITQAPAFPSTTSPGPSNRPMLIPGQTIVTLGGAAHSMPQAAVANKSGDPDLPTAKRVKKQKDGEKSKRANASSSGQSKHPSTMQQPIICGLVAPTVSSQATSISNSKTTQQYLISRPLMLNAMSGLSPAHLQQLPRSQMPILSSTAIPSSLSLPNMQQGARIVWATQPRQAIVSTSSANSSLIGSSNLFTSRSTTQANKISKSSKAKTPSSNATPTSNTARHPDNAALLSLATTALSTAPMPTTPTLSYLSGVRPPTGQAIMVSSATGQPALITGQPFFNQFMPRMPMMAHYPAVGLNPPMPGFNPAIRSFNPAPSAGMRPTTGQIVFARLPAQRQPRYLITQPYIQSGMPQTSTAVAGQPSQTLAFAAFRPPCPDNPSKDGGMKAKKVKTR